jgi:ATP-dependent Zn protease
MHDAMRRGAAYHEAGHAIVAQEVDCRVIELRIEENGDGGTDTECKYGLLSFVDRLALEYAGEVAQTMFDAQTHKMAAGHDWGNVHRLLSGLAEGTSQRLQTAGRRRAKKILAQYRQNVERVADGLMTHGRLDADAFLHLFLNKL